VSTVRVTESFRYPVKSLDGSRAEALPIEPWGLVASPAAAFEPDDGYRLGVAPSSGHPSQT
jgi:uncharacterized protein YcbX